jgi:Icc-related predicted phosphoesterase
MSVARTLSSLALAALVGSACQQKAEEQEMSAAPPVPVKAEAAKTDTDCVGPITTGAPQALTIGATNWELAGSTLTEKSPRKGDTLVVGVVTDIKEDSPENLANLREFAKWFKANNVDLIVNNGDTGETQAQIENALGILAEIKVPVLSIIGNREGRKVHKAALAAAHAKHGNIFNLVNVRRVDTSIADFVSMPGYHNPNYIHAEDGCMYTAEDTASLVEAVKASNSPVVVISHGPPHMDGPNALDRTSEGDNVGDPAIAKVIAEHRVAFGIFGNIHEAGGKAVDLKGEKVIAQNTFVDALYLHPGPADGVRWVMNDKSESVGMAAILTIKGAKASYQIKRMDDPQKKIAKGGGKKKK